MSMRDEVNDRVTEGRLFHLNPALPSTPMRRDIFVTPGVYRALMGPWDTQDEEVRFNQLRANLDTFISGDVVPVCLDPFKAKWAFLAPLDPIDDGMWDIRSRAPKPSIRVISCFTEPDVLIALDYFYRTGLGAKDSREWRDAIVGCKAEWRRLFPTYEPLVGSEIHEYITDNVFLI